MARADACPSPPLRFVIGSLRTSEQVAAAVTDLRAHHFPIESIGVLGRKELLHAHPSSSDLCSMRETAVREFELRKAADGNIRVICSATTLGNLLWLEVERGSNILKNMLQQWMLPRHAQTFGDVVEGDGFLIWAEIHDPEQERVASLSLLRTSQGPVQVQDFSTACVNY
jgi:hypothetical protein